MQFNKNKVAPPFPIHLDILRTELSTTFVNKRETRITFMLMTTTYTHRTLEMRSLSAQIGNRFERFD